jgi:hypothetical protein
MTAPTLQIDERKGRISYDKYFKSPAGAELRAIPPTYPCNTGFGRTLLIYTELRRDVSTVFGIILYNPVILSKQNWEMPINTTT